MSRSWYFDLQILWKLEYRHCTVKHTCCHTSHQSFIYSGSSGLCWTSSSPAVSAHGSLRDQTAGRRQVLGEGPSPVSYRWYILLCNLEQTVRSFTIPFFPHNSMQISCSLNFTPIALYQGSSFFSSDSAVCWGQRSPMAELSWIGQTNVGTMCCFFLTVGFRSQRSLCPSYYLITWTTQIPKQAVIWCTASKFPLVQGWARPLDTDPLHPVSPSKPADRSVSPLLFS